jgi:hypothetical protein
MHSLGRSDEGPNVHFVRFRPVKQLNVWPMLIMLIVIVLLVIWLRPH